MSSSVVYRPLLPAPNPPDGGGGGQDPSSPHAHKPSGRERPNVQVACETCRKRKTRCDGQRPKCAPCQVRNEGCVYATQNQESHHQALRRKVEELERSLEDMDQLYTCLRIKPYEEAVEILNRIRATSNVREVLAHVQGGDVLLQLASAASSSSDRETQTRSHAEGMDSKRSNA